MGLNACNWVIKSLDDHGQNLGVVILLEFLRHVVSNLTDCVQRRISNFRVGMSAVLAQNWHHHSNFLGVVDVFTNLTESHDTSVLVSPVCVVLNCVKDESSNQRQHNFLAN